MPAASLLPGVRSKTLVTLTGIILAGLLFAPSADAKAKKSTHKSSRRHVIHVEPPRRVPAARGFTTVVVDAGHGGIDPGGIPGQRIPEKPYTLDTALRLRSLLIKAGFRVVMTRSNDTFIPLPTRTSIANAQSNAVFVSIHFNSSPTWTGNGLETYYYTASSQPLAARIQARIAGGLPCLNRGVKYRGYYVLRKTSIAAVLVEGGFLTNPGEARKIQSSSYRQRLAELIAKAIIDQRGN
jgi:N-acetylmuramoyl-L-alanine amidase